MKSKIIIFCVCWYLSGLFFNFLSSRDFMGEIRIVNAAIYPIISIFGPLCAMGYMIQYLDEHGDEVIYKWDDKHTDSLTQ